MNKSGLGRVEEIIWDEIARDLKGERKVERCLCFHDRFFLQLSGTGDFPFSLKNFSGSGREAGAADLFLGWQVLEEDRPLLDLEEIFSSLRTGGEARLFGFYGSPRPEDIRDWEGRAAGSAALRLPPPGAASLGSVAGWLKDGPFNRYTIRKRGIYYDCRLGKND